MIIKNYSQIAKTGLRKDALKIIDAGYQKVDVKKIVKQTIQVKGEDLLIKNKKFRLPKHKLYLLGIGKGSFETAKQLEKILKDKISHGLVIDIKKAKLKYIKTEKGTHPLPSQKNIKTTKEIIDILKKAGKDDLILFIVCGGGSALGAAPYKLKLDKLREINKRLVNSGADIYEINTVRKHLSLFKGGQAAKMAFPAQIVSLIVSDVPGNDLRVVASGPTVKDNTSIKDAQKIAEKYDLSGLDFIETPKQSKWFKNVFNILFLSNEIALEAMKEKAEELGYKGEIYSLKIQGDARKLGRKLLNKAKKGNVLLVGGESSIKVTGKGKGGRNQSLVLAALPYIKKNQLIISIASDGRDHSEAAGAIGDKLTIKKAKKLKLDIKEYTANSDSFHFFKKTNDSIFTPQRINLSDFILIICSKI